MSSILAQDVTPTAITVALKGGLSVVIAAASIPVADNTPALVETWANTTLQAALVSASSDVQIKVRVTSLAPLVWELMTSDSPITTTWMT